MNKRIRRKKSKKNLLDNPVLEGKSRGPRARKGLNMKIGSDGSMHIRHMSELGPGLAFMPPVEIVLGD